MNAPVILLTGATGMIGTLLAQELAARGVPFRAMVREASATVPRAEIVPGDFDDPASLEQALQGIERAFLLTNSSPKTEEQQKAFVKAARKTGVRHIVKLSQLAAESDSPVRFLRYHAAVEQTLRDSGMDWTFIRPNLILQAYLPFASMIQAGAMKGPIGDAPVSVIDARDIVAVSATALTQEGHAGQTYTVTGPAAVSHAEIAAAFGRATGHEVRYEQMPEESFAKALKGMGMDPWQVDGLIEDYAHYGRGEAAFVSPDVERITGTVPRSVDDFARDHAAAFRRP